MKTKIIYISGNELFDISAIRAAFETVRSALSLDNDTVLFGVPVDNDDAFADATDVVAPSPVEETEPVVEVVEEVTVSEPQPEPIANEEPIVPEVEDIVPEKPKKTSRRKPAPVIPITRDEPESIPDDNVSATDDAEKPVIPILSVLETKTETTDEPAEIESVETETDVTLDDALVQPDVETVTISDMIADDETPIDEHEKTLEELLESMTPLGEATETEADVSTTDAIPESTKPDEEIATDDTDATLELLAAEFAETEDKIVAPKVETRGKIGKLKNILPFKKAKRDDSSLMGDLFGWAGVANDEDFTIPGFFANAASKK